MGKLAGGIFDLAHFRDSSAPHPTDKDLSAGTLVARNDNSIGAGSIGVGKISTKPTSLRGISDSSRPIEAGISQGLKLIRTFGFLRHD
jgi:hypothetical protein